MAVQLKSSQVRAEIAKGGSIKNIAERLGITTALLRKAKDTFNKGLDKESPLYINLRKKSKESVEFIMDDQNVTTNNNINNTVLGLKEKELELEESTSTTTLIM